MSATLAALAPVFGVILLGWALRAKVFTDEALWRGVEGLVYFVFFPALLVVQVARADLAAGLDGALVALAATLTLAAAMTLLVRPWAKRRYSGPTYSSIFQGAIRFQAFIGVASALAMFGDAGAAAFAVVIGLCIPAINVLCVLALSIDGHGAAPSPLNVLKSLASNPLIIAGAVGAAMNLADLRPALLLDGLAILAQGTLPVGLLAVGAVLEMQAIRRGGRPLLIASLAKFVAMPGLALGYAQFFTLDPVTLSAVLLYAALPTAASGYVLARRMGGDAPAMATIAAAQVALAAVAMPLWLAL